MTKTLGTLEAVHLLETDRRTYYSVYQVNRGVGPVIGHLVVYKLTSVVDSRPFRLFSCWVNSGQIFFFFTTGCLSTRFI